MCSFGLGDIQLSIGWLESLSSGVGGERWGVHLGWHTTLGLSEKAGGVHILHLPQNGTFQSGSPVYPFPRPQIRSSSVIHWGRIKF